MAKETKTRVVAVTTNTKENTMYGISLGCASQSAARFKAALAGAAITTLLLAGTTAHANTINLVQNGNFSQNSGPGQLNANTTVTDWTSNYVKGKSGYNFLYVPGKANPKNSGGGSVGLYTVKAGPTGGNFIAADADYETGAISQTIAGLTVGKTYDLSFNWAAAQQTGFYGPTKQEWKVTFGSQTQDTPVYDLPGEVKNGPTVKNFSGWMPDSMVFTATSNSEVLSFLASGSPQVPPFTLLANVSLTATPEPGTLPLLLTGLLVGAGLFKYRGSLRRSQQSL